MRADAERNREKILSAARAAFADGDASMAEVARRADVGMATLYRNFANRRELLEALYTDEVDALCASAQGATLDDWLLSFFDYFTGKRHIAAELLGQTSQDDPVFHRNRERVLQAGRPLFDGEPDLRDDLTLEQALDLIGAVAKISTDRAYLEPILRAALRGLRTS